MTEQTQATNLDPQSLLDQLQEQGYDLDELRKADRERKKQEKQASKRKFDKVDYSQLVHSLGDLDTDAQWEVAIEHVTMPVQQVSAEFRLLDTDTGEATGDHLTAFYDTDSGRSGEYSFIVVDRWQNGQWKALTPVTEYYGALEPKTVYENLRDALDEQENIEYSLTQVYNSYSGGRQLLELDVFNMQGMDTKEDVVMRIFLTTSLDRSKKHTMHAVPMRNGKPLLIDGGAAMALSTRHMNSVVESAVDFNVTISKLVEHWNSDLMPMMSFMFASEDISEKEIAALMTGVIDDVKLPKKTVDRLTPVIKRQTNLVDAVEILSDEAEQAESPMAREKLSEKLSTVIQRRVKKLMDKKSS